MKFTPLTLSGAFLVDLEKREDKRGFFARYFCEKEFSTHGLETRWPQMNVSYTQEAGSVRGLHFQRNPKAESKVVRCISGAIFDVLVDLRVGSPSFGKWLGFELNEVNRTMVYIPKGFAHGFQTLLPNSELLYMHSEIYNPECEGGVKFDDPILNIVWPMPIADISARDLNHPNLTQVAPIEL